MYKRSAILICLFFVLASVVCYCIVTASFTEKPELTAESSVIHTGERVLMSDPAAGGTRIYALDTDGLVRSMYVNHEGQTVVALASDANYVYALLKDLEAREAGRVVRSYRIRRFTPDLMPVQTSAPLAVGDNRRAVGISVEEDVLFVTAISDDGRTAEVYPVVLEEFFPHTGLEAEAEASEEGAAEEVFFPSVIASKDSETGRTFADAAYAGGTLHVRTDADRPVEPMALGAVETYAAQNVRLTFFQKVRTGSVPAVTWVTVTLLVVVFTALMFMAFYNRRRLVYTALIAECALLLMLALFGFFSYRIAKESAQTARRSYAQNALSSFASSVAEWDDAMAQEYLYGSREYYLIWEEMRSFLAADGSGSLFSDLFAFGVEDGRVQISAGGRNAEHVMMLYGSAAEALRQQLADGALYAFTEMAHEGASCECVAVAKHTDAGTLAVTGILRPQDGAAYARTALSSVLGNYLIVFAAASLVLFFVIWLQASDLRRLERNLQNLAVGDRISGKRVALGHDMDAMWGSLVEIDKRIEKTKYKRYKTFQAYSSFAPRHIEQILGRDSIMEVAAGDTASFDATLAFVSARSKPGMEGRLNSLNGVLQFLEESGSSGTVVSHQAELAVMQVLFLSEEEKTQRFAIDLLRRETDTRDIRPPMTVFLYHGPVSYGIAGTGEQNLTVMLLEQAREMSHYVAWLHSLALGVVATKDVLTREEMECESRHIGFIRMPDGSKVKLYEVLEACPERERQIKIAERERFAEGMSYFYKQDYYLARSRFSDVLKQLPQDEVARFYLFESERLLNEGVSEVTDTLGMFCPQDGAEWF